MQRNTMRNKKITTEKEDNANHNIIFLVLTRLNMILKKDFGPISWTNILYIYIYS